MVRRPRAPVIDPPGQTSTIARVGVGALILTLFVVADIRSTEAAFPVLSPGYAQEDIVDTTGYSGARSLAVDAGGSLLVTAQRSSGVRRSDDEGPPLHFYRLPPSGGRLDDANRLPNEVGVSSGGLGVRGGLIYGIDGAPRDPNDTDPKYPLRAYDPETGAIVREVGDWWIPHFQMTVDPLTQDLVLLDKCECLNDDSISGAIVRFNPDTGVRTVLVPDDPLETGLSHRNVLAFTPDGETLFAAGGLAGIDAYNREGELLYNIAVPHVVHGMVYGKPGTCFEDVLFYLRDDQTLWAVVDPSATAPTAPVGGGSGLDGFTGLTLDAQGRVLTVTGLDAVTAIGPDLSSPLRADCPAPTPAAPGPPAPSGEPAPEQALPAPEPPAPPLASSGDGGGASAGLAAPLGPPAGVAPQTATATQPQASAASQASQQAAQQAGTEAAAQASAAPNAVALADAPEDQPVMGFSASARAPGPPAWASLALGAVAVAFMASTTAVVTDSRRVNPATARNRRITR